MLHVKAFVFRSALEGAKNDQLGRGNMYYDNQKQRGMKERSTSCGNASCRVSYWGRVSPSTEARSEEPVLMRPWSHRPFRSPSLSTILMSKGSRYCCLDL